MTTLMRGDTVSVEEGRFRGCILTYLGRVDGWHICRNSYGAPAVIDGQVESVIRTRSVRFVRR